MLINDTQINGIKIITPEPLKDERGFFNRVFCQKELSVIRNDIVIAQINHSSTKQKGAIRGMHFQYPPNAEMKIAKCIRGSLFYVVIDVRKNSLTFLKWHGELLSSDNMKEIVVPEGCAVGSQMMEDNSEIIYLSTAFYCKESEGLIRYDDPKINIKWPLEITLVSEKDKSSKYLSDEFKGVVL